MTPTLTAHSMKAGLGCLALALVMACGGGGAPKPLQITLVPPASAMPATGTRVVFQVVTEGGVAPAFQWFKNGLSIAGADSATLTLGPVTGQDGGSYQVQVTDGNTSLETPPFELEPASDPWVVTSAADSGPGTLRDILGQANAEPAANGINGIQFNLPGPGPYLITLASGLPAITGNVCILGPSDSPLTVDGGGVCRPFFLAGGTLVLDQFTVAHGLGKGGDGPGGGGGAAGMGGALFLNGGSLTLREMIFQGNQAVGGSSSLGSDGENGGGGGFGGDPAATAGTGAGGGFLGGTGGIGYLDGSNEAGGDAHGLGAGGGAARGGDPGTSADDWTTDEPGGAGTWGGGGAFSVGPSGGGGAGGGATLETAGFGGGGGGCGGYLGSVLLRGASDSQGGIFAGDGIKGDGIAHTGQGGGGGGMGGALFLRSGTLAMHGCQFLDNRAVAGTGAYDGMGKGGAVFIYPYDTANKAPLYLSLLQAQVYSGNQAPDQVESPDYDNDDWYIAESAFDALGPASPLVQLYRNHGQQKALGLPWAR